jgi:hypothetical protein
LFFAGAAVSHAQAHGDVAVTYQWVRTNSPVGQCGCFDLNKGGGVSASWNFIPKVAVVGEVSSGTASHATSTNQSLTLTSYGVGGRLGLPHLLLLQPYVQVLVGGAHAGGGIAGAGDHTSAFAGRAGGGLDVPLVHHFAVRLVQVDYYLTKFANGSNGRQTNLLVETGLVYRWGR